MQLSEPHAACPHSIQLASVFAQECIEQIPSGATKESAIEQLLRSLANARKLTHAQVPGLTRTLMDRERAGTTALGKGLAVPHVRTELVRQFVGAIGLTPEGMNFRSIDGDPTRFILLVLGPYEQRELHFELMGRLSAMMHDKMTLMFLRGRRTAREVHDFLEDLDARGSGVQISILPDHRDYVSVLRNGQN